jgi:hypothetical protein
MKALRTRWQNDLLPAPVLDTPNTMNFSSLKMFQGKEHITDKIFVAVAWLTALGLVFLVFEKFKIFSH